MTVATGRGGAALALAARLVALGLAPPDGASVAALRLHAEGLAAAPDVADWLRELCAELAQLLADEAVVAALPACHQLVFGGRVAVSPYESSYEADPFRSSRQVADVAGFYRAFGADATGAAAERPDHVGCELEFLSFLVLRRLEAGERGDAEAAAVCCEAEDAFLREHVGRVLPLIARQVAVARGASPVHRLVALVAERLILEELDRRGLVAIAPPRARPRTAVEEDDLTCATAGEAVIATATCRGERGGGRRRRERPAWSAGSARGEAAVGEERRAGHEGRRVREQPEIARRSRRRCRAGRARAAARPPRRRPRRCWRAPRSAIGVPAEAGRIAFTRTPKLAASSAAVFVSPITPCSTR
ncbi:MAG: molecular chaperone TorD family protein [Thermoleophilia bacterium]